MTRERLPNRRQSISFPLVWRNRRYEITAAFFDDGRPAEAFVANAKAGTDIQGLSRDGAVSLPSLNIARWRAVSSEGCDEPLVSLV